MLGFAGAIGHSEILQAELMALFQGLVICWDKGYRQVQVCSDSTLALELVKGAVSRFDIYAALILSIQTLVQRSWQVDLQHTLREGNAPADFMAKFGADISTVQTMMFLTPPPGLTPFLLADSFGVPHLRP